MKEDLSGLDLFELLERLSPIPEPPTISLFPETVAWLWIGLVGLALAAWLMIRALRHRRANAYRRAALREIAAAPESPAALAEILRRTALAAFPRSDVAGLYGEAWLAFLDRTGGEGRFQDGPGRVFAQAPYRPANRRPANRRPVNREAGRAPDREALVETAELAALARRWVRRHRRGEKGEA